MKTRAGNPRFTGWKTSDADEIERRRERARTQPITLRHVPDTDPFYGDFLADTQGTGRSYGVEIRSLTELENTCACMDFRVNGLGTCKHVEKVLQHLAGRRGYKTARLRGSRITEIHLSRQAEPPSVRLRWADPAPKELRTALAPFFATDGTLLADPADGVPALRRAVDDLPRAIRRCVRMSREVSDRAADLRRRQLRDGARTMFLEDVAAGKRRLDPPRATLYPYQREGALHLAFGERAMLADDMGLGKTIQAIAAAEILAQTRRIERVLVVSPVSLKAEWEEQIQRFSGRPAQIIIGARHVRLKAYQRPPFYTLVNYEQVRSDWDALNTVLTPDLVILDEAQRIKNWQAKTADAVKLLHSPYAFVLTGTPLENRIDELYSIFQVLDPHLLGPLFRFNREFYDLDEQGRPVGCKNLDRLHRRVRTVMLRRRKQDVEEQLPPRRMKNHFVSMPSETRKNYAGFEQRVAGLIQLAKRRPLRREEFERLQRSLSCMRMLCDTPFILDQETRISPKVDELDDILEQALDGEGSKVLIFSEWARMLKLVRARLDEKGIDYAWHTGSVPQDKRRQEVLRFKEDDGCRVFLSTDSGSTGLNLQVADTVINLDLPWNPAKLEQRIARAWRKHQTRSVNVINLVTVDSIEERMLGTLALKQELADGVLDGAGDLRSLKLHTGRAALMERLETIMGGDAAPARVTTAPVAGPSAELPPEERFRQDLAARLADRLLLLDLRAPPSGQETLLVVVDGDPAEVADLAHGLAGRAWGGAPPVLEILDRGTWETLQRLARAGLVRFGETPARRIHAHDSLGDPEADARARRRDEAKRRLAATARSRQMAQVLANGGFAVEALRPLIEALEVGLRALAWWHDESDGLPAAEALRRLRDAGLLDGPSSDGITGVLDLAAMEPPSEESAGQALEAATAMFEALETVVR
ncbi:MAG: DEAD/DEAH box helicase [Pseudomonadota bacterium]